MRRGPRPKADAPGGHDLRVMSSPGRLESIASFCNHVTCKGAACQAPAPLSGCFRLFSAGSAHGMRGSRPPGKRPGGHGHAGDGPRVRRRRGRLEVGGALRDPAAAGWSSLVARRPHNPEVAAPQPRGEALAGPRDAARIAREALGRREPQVPGPQITGLGLSWAAGGPAETGLT